MKTICVKCSWHEIGRRPRNICNAPWPKKLDVVTGKQKPEYVECDRTNNGNCLHFKEKWYRRLWRTLFKETS